MLHSAKMSNISTVGKSIQGAFLQLVYLNVWPQFRAVKSDPRFQDIVKRIGLHDIEGLANSSKCSGYYICFTLGFIHAYYLRKTSRQHAQLDRAARPVE